MQGSLGYGKLLSQLVLLPFMPFKTDPQLIHTRLFLSLTAKNFQALELI